MTENEVIAQYKTNLINATHLKNDKEALRVLSTKQIQLMSIASAANFAIKLTELDIEATKQ